MSNKIRIYRYLGLQRYHENTHKGIDQSHLEAISKFGGIAFNRNTNRQMLMLSEHGIDDPNCQCVLVEYKDFKNFNYVEELPFKVYLPDGSKWLVASELKSAWIWIKELPAPDITFIIFQRPGVKPQ